MPVPPPIQLNCVVRSAMDIFDKEGRTHDTILMLFQNYSSAKYIISHTKEKMQNRKLPTVLPCQEHSPIEGGKKSGEIPNDFSAGYAVPLVYDKSYYVDH